MDFKLENIFASLEHPDSIVFLLSVFITFLIGFFAALLLYGLRSRRRGKEIKKLQAELDALRIEHQTLTEKLELKEADLIKAQRESENALQLARSFEMDRDQAQEELLVVQEEVEQLRAKQHTYEATVEALNNQILGLKTRQQQLNQEVDRDSEALNQLAKVQSSYNLTTNRLAALEKKLERLATENLSLKDELSTVKTSTEQLKVSTEELKTSTEELAVLATAPPPPVVVPAPVIEEEEPHNENLSGAARAAVHEALGSKIPFASVETKDDLTLIKGIGSFLEQKLNSLGIYTYEQISKLDEDLIQKITEAIEFFPRRIHRDDWVGQATRLHQIKLENPTALNPSNVFPDNSKDLKVIEGIGPKIEQLLKNAEIQDWKRLAGTSAEKLKAILMDAGDHFRIHDPSTWPMQAQMADDGEWEKLKEYQDFLIGGKEKK